MAPFGISGALGAIQFAVASWATWPSSIPGLAGGESARATAANTNATIANLIIEFCMVPSRLWRAFSYRIRARIFQPPGRRLRKYRSFAQLPRASFPWREIMKIDVRVALAATVCAGLVGAGAGALAAKSKAIKVVPADEVKFMPLDPKDTEAKGPQIAVVYGDMKKKAPIGFLLKVPADSKPGPHTHTSDDYAVVIKGVMHNYAPGEEGKGVGPGGYWFQPGKVVHDNHCEPGSECVFFVTMTNGFDFIPAKTAAAK
jgi:hypothetical protein